MVSTNYNFNTNTQYGGPNISQQTNTTSTSNTFNPFAQPDSFGGTAGGNKNWYGSMQSFGSALGSILSCACCLNASVLKLVLLLNIYDTLSKLPCCPKPLALS